MSDFRTPSWLLGQDPAPADLRVSDAERQAVAGPGVPLYLAGWLLIPDEGARQSVAADLIDSVSSR